MSMIPFPRRFGRHHPIFDQQQLNWEPFQDFHHMISTTQSHNIIPYDITNSFRIDWKETPEAHIYRVDLPAGLKKHEVIVEVENGYTLRISGEMKTEKAEKTDNWQRIERRSGNFLRRISLPQNSNPDKTKASLDNGVLIVIVPKGHNLMMMPHYSKIIHVSGH